MNLILWILIGVLSTVAAQHNDAPPYWRENFFIEADLPKELRGKPIQYIDSVFKVRRHANPH